jgi:DNA replication protein DnaC
MAKGIEKHLGEIELLALFGGTLPTYAIDHSERVQACGVPKNWSRRTLDTLETAFAADKLTVRYVRYARAWLDEAIETRTDLVFYGPNGTGKSGMAVSVLRGALEKGDTVRFESVPDLMIAWRELFRVRGEHEEAAESEGAMLDRLCRPSLLVLDELTGQRATEFVESTVTLIVDRRQKDQRPTILTLNVPADLTPNAETEFLAMTLGPRLMDRLRERGQFWPMMGDSKRKAFGGKS